MGFLFPLFLLAGLTLLIPVLIHLFNLRRYKHVYFPNIRFLRALQLSSKRMGRIQKKALLLSRLFFLAALVLAFAQPLVKQDGGAGQRETLHVLYLDNSPSMGIKVGQQSLFEQAKERAKLLVETLPENTRFAVLTNDRSGGAGPLTRKEVLGEIAGASPEGKSANLQTLLGKLQLLTPEQERLKVYLFSDFQETSFLNKEGLLKTDGSATFICVPFVADSRQHVFFDTVFLNSIQPGSQQPISMSLRLRSAGAGTDPQQQLRLFVNGNLKGGFPLRGPGDSVYTDSLSFQPSGSDWERLELVVGEDAVDFDDTFRLALKTRAAFEVLVSSDEGVNPFLQTAFSGFPGFTLQSGNILTAASATGHPANLLILQDLEELTADEGEALAGWLQRGRNVLIFPGSRRDKQHLNNALSRFVPLRFGAADTGLQEVVKLEAGHPLVYDMFEHLPENMALPVARLHFPVEAGFAAAEQVVMRFRDGTPFLAQYQVGKGKLFVCASPLGTAFSDFPLSYFFAPLLYKMAMPAGSGMVFTTISGSEAPVWISSRHFDERAVWHARREGYTFIPRQRLSGAGVHVYLGETADRPGFYQLYQDGNQDTFLVAVNGKREESYLKPVSRKLLAGQLAPATLQWVEPGASDLQRLASGQSQFPLWKLAVIFALLAIMIETIILIRPGSLIRPGRQPKSSAEDRVSVG